MMTEQPTSIEDILQSSLEALLADESTLEDILERYPQQRWELKPRLEAALWLRAGRGEFEPRPGFVSASRQRLVARIQAEQAEQAARPRRVERNFLAELWGMFTARPALALQLAVVMALLVGMIFAGGGVALASFSAIPGEPLYGVKLAVENAELALTFSAAGDAELHIEFAERRALELQALMLENQYQHIAATVSRYERHLQMATEKIEAVQQQDPASARRLAITMQVTLDRQNTLLSVLAQTAPPEVRVELQKAISSTERGIAASEEIIREVEENLPTMRDTPPVEFAASATPTPSATGTATVTTTVSPSPSDTATETPLATATATPSMTPTSTSTVAPPTATSTPRPANTSVPDVEDSPTPRPTATEVEVPPTPPPDPTDEPTEEPKPTKTPKPLPSPTRRPTKDS